MNDTLRSSHDAALLGLSAGVAVIALTLSTVSSAGNGAAQALARLAAQGSYRASSRLNSRAMRPVS